MAVNQYGDSNHIPDQNAHQTETKNQKTSEKREILRLKLVIYFFKSLYELVRSWVLLNGYYSKTPESYIFLNWIFQEKREMEAYFSTLVADAEVLEELRFADIEKFEELMRIIEEDQIKN